MSVWTPTMNIPSTGNSGNKNRKRPTLAVLATATLLLAAISLIGVGAIPQPQAFAQSSVNQTGSQSGSNTAFASGGSTVDQTLDQSGAQDATATGESTITQELNQVLDQFANATE
jgi:hypothetical protein